MSTLYTKTKLTALLILYTLLSTAQSWQWSKRAGSSGDNVTSQNGQYNEMVTDVKVDKAGNVYATGYFFANPSFMDAPGFAPATPPGFGMRDAYLIKYTACGKTLWSRRMGGTGEDEAGSLVLDNSGHVIVLGFCTGIGTDKFGDGIHDTTVSANAGIQFIARFDTAGNFKSVKNYPWAYSKLLVNSQGNYIVTDGLSAVKMTPAGVPTFTYNFAVPAPHYPDITGISMDKNDNIYLAGYFGDTVNVGPGTILAPTASTFIANTNANNSLIMKFSPGGTMLWYKRGNSSVSDALIDCSVDTSGTKIATGGGAWNGSVVFSYYVNGGVGSVGVTFFLLDAATGNFLSAKTGSANGQALIGPYLTDRDNNFICKGSMNGFLAFNTTTYTAAGTPGNRQNCIGKFDAAGNFVSINLLPQMGTSSGDEQINGMAMSEQGNIYIGGMFGGTLDSAGTAVHIVGGTEDGFVAKYGYACNSNSASLSPLAPASLTAVYQPSLTNKVTWIDNSQYETGFELWAIGGNITTYSLIATLAANTTTYTHSNLLPAKTYCYKVRAVNAAGPSIYTNIGCATTPSATTPGTYTGIADLTGLATFELYPNPTTGVVNLKFAFNGGQASIDVINQLGEVVYQSNLQTLTGDNKQVIELPKTKGMYFVSIKTSQGKAVKKVVVE